MCVSPISLTRECCGKKYQAFVPCGVCPECIKDKQNEYVIRSVEEAMKTGNVWFITLTYSNDTVPVKFDEDCEIIDEETGEVTYEEYLTLNNKDITNWKKRVRRSIEYHEKRKLDFSYLICGEYGPRTNRPHYHGLLIGLDDSDVMKFKLDWEKHHGFTCFKHVSKLEVDRVAAYTAKYICKQRELENPAVFDGKVEKPRKITSYGYGMPTKARFDRLRKDILGPVLSEMNPDHINGNPIKIENEVNKIAKNKKKRYKLNGREYKLPAYYWRKITYVKDEVTGKVRSSQLSTMVSKALQDRVQTDFAGKLIKMATDYNLAENYEECVKASKIVCDSEKMERQNRAEAIIQTNIAAFRKSRF